MAELVRKARESLDEPPSDREIISSGCHPGLFTGRSGL
jgi:hypothetical protein